MPGAERTGQRSSLVAAPGGGHISDPKQRPEEFRHHSVVTAYAVEVVAGQGIDGYRTALEVVAREVGAAGPAG